MFDVVALGESLIDFVPCGINDVGMTMFSRNPGGAPANVLAMNAKLGGKTAFIGKVGNDDFGIFLKNTMANVGIDCKGLKFSKEIPTTLAFIHLNNQGDRSFSFYRNPGADIMLTWKEVNKDLLEKCNIFHFGGVSLTSEPCRTATLNAAKYARERGALISYDPNYRPLLWRDSKIAIDEMKVPLSMTDILKVSFEEMELLTGKTSLTEGASLLSKYGIQVVLITLGEEGAFFYSENKYGIVNTFKVDVVDTTGAGDAFLGAIHYCLRHKTREEISLITKGEWIRIIKFCNAAGSLTTTAKGAIIAMPSKEKIEEQISNS